IRDHLPITGITELNIQTGSNLDFPVVVAALGSGFTKLRVLRLKHMVDVGALHLDDFPPPPWALPHWKHMLRCFPTIEVLYINTPLKFKSHKRPFTELCKWKKWARSLQRVYLFHGHAEDYDLHTMKFLLGDFQYLRWVPGPITRGAPEKWVSNNIEAPTRFSHLEPFEMTNVIPEDREPYGPWDDQENAINPRGDDDNPEWFLEGYEEDDQAMDEDSDPEYVYESD
ncbi:hypothetical protein BDN72DRAFT_866393, partial [Pluteus cervinus]